MIGSHGFAGVGSLRRVSKALHDVFLLKGFPPRGAGNGRPDRTIITNFQSARRKRGHGVEGRRVFCNDGVAPCPRLARETIADGLIVVESPELWFSQVEPLWRVSAYTVIDSRSYLKRKGYFSEWKSSMNRQFAYQ